MKILVTGSNGLIGQSLKRIVNQYNNHQFYFATRQKDGSLCFESHVNNIFSKLKPDYVIHAAAKVGGIQSNINYQAEFFYDNILMNTYVIDACHKYNVKKLIAFSSVCVFPDKIGTLTEDLIHMGEPYAGNRSYALAKRAMDHMITAYKDQHSIKNYCQVIMSNIFGPHDYYNLENAHVVPALIHKLYLAKHSYRPFNVWGNGSALREFIYVDDVTKIVMQLLDMVEDLPQRLIVAGDKQHTIKEIVDLLVEVSNFDGQVNYQLDKPNGQDSRPTDLSLLKKMFPNIKYTDIKNGLKQSYDWFEQNYEMARK